MTEKAFLAKVEEEVLQAFRLKCKAQGYPLGDCVEALMTQFASRVDDADFVLAVRTAKKDRKVKESEPETVEPAATASGGEGV